MNLASCAQGPPKHFGYSSLLASNIKKLNFCFPESIVPFLLTNSKFFFSNFFFFNPNIGLFHFPNIKQISHGNTFVFLLSSLNYVL